MGKNRLTNSDAVKELSYGFLYHMNEIESLAIFFDRSQTTFKEYFSTVNKEYKKGQQLSNYFNYVLGGKTVEEQNKRIEEIKSKKIDDKLKVSDICIIEPFDEEETDPKTLMYSMRERFAQNEQYSPEIASKRFTGLGMYSRFMIESFLSNLVVVFESFLSFVYRILLEVDPHKYIADHAIPMTQVLDKEYDVLVSEFFNEEVESKMRDSLSVLSLISEKEGICIERYEKILDDFYEIYYRRNAYVHTGGCANKDYLRKVSKKHRGTLNEGDLLVSDNEYSEKAIGTLSKIVFSIVFELYMKLGANEKKYDSLSNYCFEKLTDCDYSFCKLAYYALSQHKESSFSQRMVCRVNYINCLKQLGYDKELEKELEQLDVSAATDDFRIAKECLANNNSRVFELLTQTYPKSFRAYQIKRWPLFIDFRKTEYYEQFRNEHKEDFEIDIVELQDQPKIEECR